MKRNFYGLVLIVAVGLGASSVATAPATSRATAAFQKLQGLTGAWDGTDEQGKTVKSSFQRIVSDTTVMETLVMHGAHEMITLYNVDGDGIALVHYCPTNNQPRMRAIPTAGEVRELEFAFQGAGNLPSLAEGHEHKLILLFRDQDHITEHWTWRENGKDSEMIYQFTRKHAN
jgi:hypothetical protein